MSLTAMPASHRCASAVKGKISADFSPFLLFAMGVFSKNGTRTELNGGAQSTVKCGSVQSGAIQSSALKSGQVQLSALQSGALNSSQVQLSALKCGFKGMLLFAKNCASAVRFLCSFKKQRNHRPALSFQEPKTIY